MKVQKYLAGLMLLWLLIPMLTTSCVKEEQYLTNAVELQFSSDTVAFDTVFTTMGTITQQVKVYNTYDQPLRIATITLRQGPASRFRLNVDGDTSMVVRNLEIAAHDSIFIFVQACINPNSELEPFLLEDAILFDCNGRTQQLPLTAYGRNAVYHMPDHTILGNGVSYPYSVIDCGHWDHTRPHVIFGYAVVDSSYTLNLNAGEELYFANNGYLWVYRDATLVVHGTPESPVLFTSLRHDGHYDQLPGQWGYVWLSSGSKNNVIDWAVIENAQVGVLVDTNVNSNPTLTISNSRIYNHSLAGIIGQGAVIEGDNLLVSDCATATLVLQYGGSYRFTNSTFANYWQYDRRTSPGVVLNNYYIDGRPLRRAEFMNCIIYGSYSGPNGDGTGEILFDIDPATQHNISFSHCLLKSTLTDDMATYCLTAADPQFVDVTNHDYHLKTTSPCVGAGTTMALSRQYDLDNQPRDNPPTIGAFELSSTASRSHRRY